MITITARITLALLVALAFVIGAVRADDFTIDWRTVDGGGATWSTGGVFELGGTIGQPDAGAIAMTGGDYSLTGGFWAAPPCWCLSDLNKDGHRDGLDAQRFVDCVLLQGTDCSCADLVTDGALDVNDVDAFVGDLLAGETCP